MANELTKTNLDKHLYQLRRIEEHRTAGAEKEIRRIYKDIVKDLQAFLSDIYVTYSEDDMLDYSMLFAAGQDARFLEEVEQRINDISRQVSSVIKSTVNDTYEACYNGLNNAVMKAAGNTEVLTQALQSVKACTPEVIRQAVNNPIAGLTLNDRLEKNRKEIIYDIKQNIGVGLTNGDRYSTMAKRISESVEGDYNKAIRIVRTETHRVREAGMLDAAQECNTALKNGKSGKVLAKTWRTMQDERVRPLNQKGKAKQYNHVKMDGVSVLVDEEFTLPSGARGKAPSQTGVAGEDINCRCYLSYDLVPAEQVTGNGTGETPKDETPDAGQTKAIDANNLPQQFTATRAEAANTKKWVDYVNNVEGADANALKMYNNMANMGGDAQTIDMTIKHGKKHSVGAREFISTGEIEVEINIPKISGDDIAGQVQTTMHELGHYIDLLNKDKTTRAGGWVSANNPKLIKAFKGANSDIGDGIKKVFADHKKDYDAITATISKQRKEAIEKLKEEYGGNVWQLGYSQYKEYEKKFNKIARDLDKERDYLCRNIGGGGISSLQDIYDALSGGVFRDTGVVTYGHGSKYYAKTDLRLEETFANYSALSVTRPDLIQLLREDKPELCEALDSLIADIVKEF